jgi:hypothetical protein
MKNWYVLLLAGLTFFAAACKRTAEGEKASYEQNKKRLEKLGAEYPGFKTALQALITEAEPEWKKAEGLSGEEQIKAMAAVNGKLAPNYVYSLERLKDDLNALKDAKTKAPQQVKTDGEKASLAAAIEEANITLNRIEGELKSREASTGTEVQAIVEGWKKEIEAAKKRIDDIAGVASQAKEEEKKNAEEAQKKEEAAKAPIKCKKCGTKCDPTKGECKKCSACGAPLG